MEKRGDAGVQGIIGAFALAILAYKGFTTITNSASGSAIQYH